MQSFVLGGPWRAGIGAVLFALCLSSLWIARTIDWGVGWMVAFPAAVGVIPAWALLQRRVISRTNHGIDLTDGWLWRRAQRLRLDATCELEMVPTAGLYAVVLHRAEHAYPLATWIRGATATRLSAWLDDCVGTPLVRRAAVIPAADR